MIEKLTKEQQDLLAVYRDKWITIGLSTEPADQKEAEKGIKIAYQKANLKTPNIVWCSSPINIVNSVWDSVRGSVQDSVRDSVRGSVQDSVRDSVRGSVQDSVWSSVWDSVRDSVQDSVRGSVWGSVWSSVWDSVQDSVWDFCYGQHDAGWLGFYDYFREVLSLEKETDKITGLIQQAKYANWFLPLKNECYISERHNVLNRDERGHLHAEDNPALAYPDGFSVYAIHGVRVPEYVVMNPQLISVYDIDEESNTEIRRVKIERYGTSRYLLDSGAKVIHEYTGNVKGLVGGKLYYKQIKNDEPICMVGVFDSTLENGKQRQYFLEVPPDIKTVEQAVAWTYGMSTDEYLPMKES